MVLKKTFRYYYWVITEFLKKHFKIIAISSFASFVFIISLISLSPFIESFFVNKTEVIGLIGNYDTNNLPDEIYSKISTGLVYINENGEIKPTLAFAWEIRNNGKEYRFHLKDSLIWNDGKIFSASDINYQFKDVKVNVIDDKTIEFVLNKPLLIFPSYLRKPIIRRPLIGVAGLYKVVNIKSKYDHIVELSLEPNKKNIAYIKYRFYPDENQLITAYKKGEITKMSITKKNIAEQFMKWNNSEVIKSVDYSRLLTLFFNFTNPLLKEKDIKNAIATAINVDDFKPLGELAKGPIPPISWAYNTSLKSPQYDLTSSQNIFKKNITASTEAQMNLVTYYDYYDMGDQIANALKGAGLSVNLNVISYDKPSQFDMLLAFWKVPEDPDQYYFWHSTQTQGNIGGYNNVKVDKLLEDGRSSTSIEERKRIYFEFQRVIQDDTPGLFLYYPYLYTIKRK
ncbi:MAG: ABC transporter substrate-binding protein [bacterium]|nr:ABC transporter substrate-binding protein [bacterium]